MTEYAGRAVVSHPDESSTWGCRQLDTGRFRGHLRRPAEDLAVGRE